jgi:hypothetical protein
MRLAIGVIVSSGFRCDTEFLFGRAGGPPEGLFALAAHIQTGAINATLPDDLKITDVRLTVSRKFPTDVARNEICTSAVADGYDYLLFLDADMVHPVDMVAKLMQARKPVITARYHLKKAPFAAIAYVKHRTQEGPHKYLTVHFGQGVFEIERGGAGALLIHRDVLEGIEARQSAQWAHVRAETIGLTRETQNLLDVPAVPTCQWFRYQRGPEPPHDMTVSEDFWFYRQAREAGFSCWIDWDCECPHVGPMAIEQSWNTPFLHTQVAEYQNPDVRDVVLKNTVVRGYPGGMELGEDGTRVEEYQITPGER